MLPLPDPATQRILALDVGDVRIGVAISGELGLSAQPLLTLRRSTLRADLKSLARLVRKYAVTHVVVGNPLYMSGDLSPQALKAQSFAAVLAAELGVTIHLWDERLTTTQAHRQLDDAGRSSNRQDRKHIIDQVAAVLILESFLDARSLRASHP
jgi:putative Holliday junction resolvase